MYLPDIIPQIQVTLDCNFQCAYCFQTHGKGVIDLSIVEAILEKAVAHNFRNRHFPGHTPMVLVWHGGEPLLAGLKFFQKIIQMESLFPEINFHNRVQTNGSLMTDDFAQFFAEHHFHVGFSLDGPEEIHNQNRRFAGSNTPTFKAAMKGVETFRRFARPERISAIAVVTRASMGREKEFFEFFKTLKAQIQLDIYDLRCLDLVGPSDNNSPMFQLAPSSDEIALFLINLFDLWFHDTTGRVDFNELRNEVKMILQPEMDRGDPYHKKRCHPGRIIFDPLGRVYSCDQYVNDAGTALGDIRKDSLDRILAKKIDLWETIKHHVRKSGKKMACFSCEMGHQHTGGCLTCMKYNALLLSARQQGLPDDQWFEADLAPPLKELPGETYYCKGLQTFRNHVKKIVHQELSHG